MFTVQEQYQISASRQDSDGDWKTIPMDSLNKADNVCIFVDRDNQEQITEAGKRLHALRMHCEQSDEHREFKGSMRAIPVETKKGDLTKVQLNRRAGLSFSIEDLIGKAVDASSI